MREAKFKVYIKLDENKIIKRIESNISSSYINFTDWLEIDEGYGDKFSHAQSQYLERGLTDEKGRYNYKYDNALVELTEEEKNILFPPVEPKPSELEILRQEKEVLAKSVYDLTSIVELLIQGEVK